MDSLQPVSYMSKPFGATTSNNAADKFDNKLYFSSLASKHLKGLSDLVDLLIEVNLSGPDITYGTEDLIGEGAQYRVFRTRVFEHSNDGFLADVVAVKQPRFFLETNKTLNLATRMTQRQLHDIYLEILVLHHPSLRTHRNIVKSLFWTYDTTTFQWPLLLGQEIALSDLAKFLHNEGPALAWSTRYVLCLDVGAGLDALHQLDIVHGDLKPANVLIFNQDGLTAKLADFGMSLYEDMHAGEIPKGTPGWQAPEIQLGSPLQPSDLLKADNYSFGLLLWSSMFLRGICVRAHDLENKSTVLKTYKTEVEKDLISSYFKMSETICNLLQTDPEHRPEMISDSLDDGTPLYQDWAIKYSSESSSKPKTDDSRDSVSAEHQWCPWIPPCLGGYLVEQLKTVFKDDLSLIEPSRLLTVFLHSTKYWQNTEMPEDSDQIVLLEPLVTAALLGSAPAMGLLPLVCRSLQCKLPYKAQRFESQWLTEAVETGSMVAGLELKKIDSDAFRAAANTFRKYGGYNQFHHYHSGQRTDRLAFRQWAEGYRDRVKEFNLYYEVAFGNSHYIKESLERLPIDVNASVQWSQNALYVSCLRGNWDVVEVLLAHGADPSIPYLPGGFTCLHWIFAFDEQSVEHAAKALVKSGASVMAFTYQELPLFHYPFLLPCGTPLHWAVATCQNAAIKSLLALGADPSVRNGDDPYIYDEIFRSTMNFRGPDWVKYSVADGTTLGLSPLDLAVMQREPYILHRLIEMGSYDRINDVDEEGCSAFHRLESGHLKYTFSEIGYSQRLFWGEPETVQQNLRDTIRALIRLGGDINQFTNPRSKSSVGMTPLMLALQANQPESIAELLKAGADVNVRNIYGANVLFFLQQMTSTRKRKRSLEAVETLVSYGVDIYCRDNLGQTPITHILDLEIVDLLLDMGADITERVLNPRNMEFGYHVLALLARGYVSTDSVFARFLSKHLHPIRDHLKKADLMERADLKGTSLLHLMAWGGFPECVKILIKEGARINAIHKCWTFEGSASKRLRSETPLDTALQRRDSNLRILYRREHSTFSRAELESKVEIYDQVARILRRAGGKLASECKKNPSLFPSTGKEKLREIYRSNSM